MLETKVNIEQEIKERLLKIEEAFSRAFEYHL